MEKLDKIKKILNDLNENKISEEKALKRITDIIEVEKTSTEYGCRY